MQELQTSMVKNGNVLGRVNIGWTIGEELLFETEDLRFTTRAEHCFAETESCLLGINKTKLANLQKELLQSGNTKDYYVLESVLKGNFLIKQDWKRQGQNLDLQA